ncbi:MAG: VTT domain-containing protein [Ignavibacteria bacterium]|nr:VTT domain-containing protein [Ignavibacteria bacterium]
MWAGYLGLAIIIFTETGLLAGFFLPGDSLLVTAGLFAATHDPVTGEPFLNIVYLNLSLIPSAIIGDATGYWIGSKAGPRLFKKEKSFFFRKDYLIKTREFYEKYGGITIIIARFMPIIRTFAPTVAGIAKMKYIKFAQYNIFGGILWVLSMTLLGFYLGRLVPGIEKHIDKVIIIIVFLSILPGIIKYIKHKLQQRKENLKIN